MADALPLRPPPPRLDDACALFLDVDGTLIEFADRPDGVHLLPEVREAIARISARLHGALALVSGRPLAQLDALFAPLRLPAAGLHGHELRSDINARAAMPADTSQWLHGLHQRAAHLRQAHPGVLVEDKGASLALHWRAAPEAGPHVIAFAEEQIEALPGYRLQPGDHVVEFVPEGSDKGVALTTMLLQPPFQGRRPVFVGDDLTDEFGFAAANRHGGWSVLVGARANSAATFALPDPHGVHAWLRDNAA
ncbi:trehalose-phosphatase [Xanthomonas hyacinthi]|uniref:Trehalose 6-phosphate phosphatase n=1 Tax=Xanthomonas hyacinthi TaxID=56455 RepID=A0A2S7F3E4_9XANT|nr:trehalose-phosphatase [Xanthomonas hyacinthi]KLD77390.1 trehalose phosphatase [Xanthomonas hyacinthi DSM 19077]PPU99809.1 trehalose-phosphatase [Xanthomonas hyacinthi]QGY75965.1 trehalose-phosphatase [Xanthomonas hyacinthi]